MQDEIREMRRHRSVFNPSLLKDKQSVNPCEQLHRLIVAADGLGSAVDSAFRFADSNRSLPSSLSDSTRQRFFMKRKLVWGSNRCQVLSVPDTHTQKLVLLKTRVERVLGYPPQVEGLSPQRCSQNLQKPCFQEKTSGLDDSANPGFRSNARGVTVYSSLAIK